MYSENIEMLQIVAKGFEELVNQVVFVGGATAELYGQTSFAEEVRPTKDVDCVVEITSRIEYDKIQEKIRKKGFRNDISPEAPMFRWIYKGIKVDIMPPDEKILGFSNKWYSEGIKQKTEKELPNGIKIFIFKVEYFLATKFEAHKTRGGADLRQSKDFEDIIYVLDNYPNLYEQINQSVNNVKQYLKEQCTILLNNNNLTEGIETALPYGANLERTEMIMDILKQIGKMK
ncbi:MAG: hypothetical protein JXR68_12480 [Bacteroidales bacterium]|nr:hypothetical protein [Bacteroidales bacterium]